MIHAYRYHLDRRWGFGPRLGWVMLNPSTADADTDDPTIRKCCGFARHYSGRLNHWSDRLGGEVGEPHPTYGGIVVANLYPLRATDPADLARATEDERIGDEYDADMAIASLAHKVDGGPIVLAWGANGARYPDRVSRVLMMLQATGADLRYLGLTRSGQPWHPLMVAYATPLSRWSYSPLYLSTNATARTQEGM